MCSNFIIAGGRDFTNEPLMTDRLFELEQEGLIVPSSTLICGMAQGADLLGRKLCLKAGLQVRDMPAEWDKLGKRAGFARNEAMGLLADFALVFWDGQSKGTAHMISVMDRLNKPCYVVNYINAVPMLTHKVMPKGI